MYYISVFYKSDMARSQTPPLRRSPTMEQGVQASESTPPQKDNKTGVKSDGGGNKPTKGPIQRQPPGQRRRFPSREERPPSRESQRDNQQDNREKEARQERSSQGAKDRQPGMAITCLSHVYRMFITCS